MNCVIPTSFTLPQRIMHWRFTIHDIILNILYYIRIKIDKLVINE